MNLAASSASILGLPIGAYALPTSEQGSSHSNDDAKSWGDSLLNPRNPLDSINTMQPGLWRIDGSSSFGTQFQVTPISLIPNLIPTRIDVFIPDQATLSRGVRSALGSDLAFCILDKRVAELGISKLILGALDRWTLEQTDFRKTYNSFPYGSRIVLENLATSPSAVRVLPIKSFEVERRLLSLERLKEMWKLPNSIWPESIELDILRLIVQIHDSVSKVRIPSKHDDNQFIFKSATSDAKSLYHELKNLLSLPRHQNIMPPPLYLVTISNRYQKGQLKLCGLIFPYFPTGSLAGILTKRKISCPMDAQELSSKLQWCNQIVSGLIAINDSPVRFYSELKPDNILLNVADDGKESLVLIDFEQMGNWMDFSPPEVFYIEYLAHLVESELVPEEDKKRYRQMALDQGIALKPKESIYTNPPLGYYEPWISFDATEIEAAEVYTFGMVMWCIFESVSSPRHPVARMAEVEEFQEFPEMRRTPPGIADLIKRCTLGTRLWGPSVGGEIVRRGSKIYPKGQTGINNETEATEVETRQFVWEMWRSKLYQMEDYFAARKRWREGAPAVGDNHLLGATLRPKLQGILDELAHFSKKIG